MRCGIRIPRSAGFSPSSPSPIPTRCPKRAAKQSRAAYGRLPDALKAEIEPLTAIHDYVFSRGKVAPVRPSHAASLPPVEQKLVRANPSTGARNYYVGFHPREVVGWGRGASRCLFHRGCMRQNRVCGAGPTLEEYGPAVPLRLFFRRPNCGTMRQCRRSLSWMRSAV